MGKIAQKLRRTQYELIWHRGVQMDRRTASAFDHAEQLLSELKGRKVSLIVTQGSPSGVVASAGTHAGRGAVDVYAPAGVTHEEISWAFRLAGWAWWHRPASRSWKEHGHGLVIGHPKLSPSAKAQVQQYLLGTNGLANHGRDADRRLPWRITDFRYPLMKVSLSAVAKEARKKNRRVPRLAVRRVQATLNLKTKAGLKVDGIYGPATKAAMKRFEHAAQVPRVDGIPGGASMRALGGSQFIVTK